MTVAALALVGALVPALLLLTHGEDDVRVRAGAARKFLRVDVYVQREADHRLLVVQASDEEGAGWYRRSDVQLDGEDSPYAHRFEWRANWGIYDVTADAYDARGKRCGSAVTKVMVPF